MQPLLFTSPGADARLTQLHSWLCALPAHWKIDCDQVQAASSDASFRRYFRVSTQHPQYPSLIVMDAPPMQEDCRPFIAIAALFAKAGVHVPTVFEQDIAQGFLLLSDLGQITYADALNATTAEKLYGDASAALLKIQQASQPDTLPHYSATLLQNELHLFDTWYLKHHHITLTDTQKNHLHQIYQTLIENHLAQASTYVHRDYHCRNLMVTSDNSPGILDFQDAVYGPITYDLVSLWRDAYIDWEEAQQIDWLARYWTQAKQKGLPVPTDFGEFYRDYEWMGLQRHLKVLGIFSRLYHRDGKKAYLQYLPRVFTYAHQVTQRYREFKPLLTLLDQIAATPSSIGYTF
ncbi:MAG: phosphotransferase [Ottowia sp.]|nr:phosphotransferase [Ottowia sp.]